MPNLIDSVAAIIDVRVRDDLEQTLAVVMHELVCAASLTLWRVVRDDDATGFQERVFTSSIAESCVAPTVSIDGRVMRFEDMNAEARAAFERSQYVRAIDDEGDLGRHVFPVTDATEVVGLVEIVCAPPLSPEQEHFVLGLIRIYRSHLGILENTDTDELTGLSNRRPFDETFRRLNTSTSSSSRIEARRAAESVASLAELAILDIDFFKRINDAFGHPYGDEVLVRLAQLMRQSFRSSDRFFRFGGEEFVVILPETRPDDADVALERFRETICDFAFPLVGRVTISLGVTSIRRGETGTDAFGRADAALYLAKQGGRNQLLRYETLVLAGALQPNTPPEQEIEMF